MRGIGRNPDLNTDLQVKRMSTTPAASATAPTTETTEKAPVIPGRQDVLKHFAREASGLPPEEAEPTAETPAAAAEEEVALSQPTESTTETAPETPEEVEAPDAPENHLDEEERTSLPPEIQEKINRRIGREVAKRKAEQDAREAVEAELAALKARPAPADEPETTARPVPLANIDDPAKLEAEKVKAEDAVEQSEDLLNALEDDPESVERTLRAAKVDDRMPRDENGKPDYSAAGMRKFLRTVKTNADRMLRRSIPERRAFLTKAEEAAKLATDYMPELKDAKSDRFKKFQQVLRENPMLKNSPEWPWKAMVGVFGMEQLEQLAAARKKPAAPAAKREIPVTIPAPRAAPQAPRASRPAEPDVNAVADKLLSGEKSARLQYIKSLVPKIP